VPAGSDIAEPIRLFSANVPTQFIDAGQKGYGKVLLTFTRAAQNLKVGMAGSELFTGKRETAFLEPNTKGDTVHFWYNPLEYPDDLNFLMLNISADSVRLDSVRVLLQKTQAPQLKLSQFGVSKIGPADTLFLQSPVPILSLNQSLITVTRDSLPVPFKLTQPEPRKLALYFEKKPASVFEIQFQPEAITDLFGRQNDSIALKTVVATDEEKAIVNFNITAADNRPKVFELLLGNKVLRRIAFTESLIFAMKYVEPGKFGIRIIWDDNQNNLWDVGDFGTRTYPEQVMYYPKPIELRANWELDVVWEVPEP
jgi:hypothetical protein